MVSAAPRLSPDIITVRMPRAFSAASASRAPGLGSSPKASSACSARPLSVRTATADTVAPSACSCWARSASAAMSTPSSCIQRRLPTRYVVPCTAPSVPRPGTARTLSGEATANCCASAAAPTARASGCSLPLCIEATAAITCAASSPGTTSNAVRRGLPTVRVPVLSNATTSTLCASSSACASLIRMPCFAATPVPAMMAAGVARPSAHGQAMTSTATAWINASSTGAPANSQPTTVSSAITSTTGTNTFDTWSTSR